MVSIKETVTRGLSSFSLAVSFHDLKKYTADRMEQYKDCPGDWFKKTLSSGSIL